MGILKFLAQGDGNYEVVEDFIIDEWLDTKIKASENELRKERDCVGHLVSSCNADLHFKHARLWDLRWHIEIYAHWDCTK